MSTRKYLMGLGRSCTQGLYKCGSVPALPPLASTLSQSESPTAIVRHQTLAQVTNTTEVAKKKKAYRMVWVVGLRHANGFTADRAIDGGHILAFTARAIVGQSAAMRKAERLVASVTRKRQEIALIAAFSCAVRADVVKFHGTGSGCSKL